MSEARGSRRPQFVGFPRGWFVVGFSHELAKGDVRQMKYFGKQLVLFRDEEGRASILDAYCPHLGADLAKGKVVGDTIECPFHAWRFNGEGKCTHIPYAEKIPKKALVDPWVTTERSGLILVWHHPEGGAPDFDVPILPEVGDSNWLQWQTSEIRIATHPREIVENVVDKGHFAPVHSTFVDSFENEFVDHMATQRTKGKAYPVGGGVDHFFIEATYHGPAIQFSRMEGVMDSRLVNAHTPIDENSLDLRFGVMLKMLEGQDEPKMKTFAARYVDNLTKGFHEDREIWENKCFREVPVLCDGDGPIMKLRKWYGQFYTQPEAK